MQMKPNDTCAPQESPMRAILITAISAILGAFIPSCALSSPAQTLSRWNSSLYSYQVIDTLYCELLSENFESARTALAHRDAQDGANAASVDSIVIFATVTKDGVAASYRNFFPTGSIEHDTAVLAALETPVSDLQAGLDNLCQWLSYGTKMRGELRVKRTQSGSAFAWSQTIRGQLQTRVLLVDAAYNHVQLLVGDPVYGTVTITPTFGKEDGLIIPSEVALDAPRTKITYQYTYQRVQGVVVPATVTMRSRVNGSVYERSLILRNHRVVRKAPEHERR
jgi:hypothetical protein